jgi:hypothetical protein
LDVSKNIALMVLNCSDNNLTSLDVSKNPDLDLLYCSGNKLTSLDVSKNTALAYLYCNNNRLTSLDLSKNTQLKKNHLEFHHNYIPDSAARRALIEKFGEAAVLPQYDGEPPVDDANPDDDGTAPDDDTNQYYTVLKDFGTFTGSGTVSCEIDTDSANPQLQYLWGANWDANGYWGELPEGLTYTVSQKDGHTIFTLNEAGLKTLKNGTHAFKAVFASGSSGLRLIVDQPNPGNGGDTVDEDMGIPVDDDANSGDANNGSISKTNTPAVEIISDGGAKYTLGTGKPLVVKSPRSMSGEDFTALVVDGNALALEHKSATLWENAYAKVEEGSTVATLYPSYLDTLSAGAHTVTLAYADGNNATVTFEVAQSSSPKTGDETPLLALVTLLLISVAGCSALYAGRRRLLKKAR